MNLKIKNLVRKNVSTMIPYQSARRIGGEGDVWLNANEFPLSKSFKVHFSDLNRYPEFQPRELINSYSKYSGCSPNKILVTRGADEGIEILVRAFCEPNKDAIIICPPTYDMYHVCAQLSEVECKYCFMRSDWSLNIDDIEKNLDFVKLIYICSPNNPTGNIINVSQIQSVLELSQNKSLVVVDEAYIEFLPESSVTFLMLKYSNLVILRTLSKAFGLAGIRCGFTLANPEVIKILSKVIAPYPISTLVSKIAVRSLSIENIKKMKMQVIQLNANKKWLLQKLKQCSCVSTVFDSAANFLLVKFNSREIIFNRLKSKGIIVRDQSEKYGLKECIRISIGTTDECIRLINVIKQYNNDK